MDKLGLSMAVDVVDQVLWGEVLLFFLEVEALNAGEHNLVDIE